MFQEQEIESLAGPPPLEFGPNGTPLIYREWQSELDRIAEQLLNVGVVDPQPFDHLVAYQRAEGAWGLMLTVLCVMAAFAIWIVGVKLVRWSCKTESDADAPVGIVSVIAMVVAAIVSTAVVVQSDDAFAKFMAPEAAVIRELGEMP